MQFTGGYYEKFNDASLCYKSDEAVALYQETSVTVLISRYLNEDGNEERSGKCMKC